MTDTALRFHPDMTFGQLREQGVRVTLATVSEQWLAWCGSEGQPDLWARAMCFTGSDASWDADTWTQLERGELWERDLRDFLAWAQANRNRFEEEHPVTDTTTIAPIDPSHPMWSAWWDDLYEHARENDYLEQYNALARALEGPEHEDERDEEIQVEIEVRIEAFYVRRTVTMTRAQYEDNDAEDLAQEYLNQSDIDDMVREHVSREDVDWQGTDTTER